MTKPINFASDNASGAAPEILAALAACNEGAVPSYGEDEVTRAAEAALAALFEHEVAVFFVGTGTAANALALSALVRPFGAAICHDEAHIFTDEAGAPEFIMGGAKLLALPTQDGKLFSASIDALMQRAHSMGVHHVMPEALSLTNATEWGTIYRHAEIADLAECCRRHGLRLHMDGARFANVVASSGESPADLSWRAGVDVLCFGGTKNGAMAAEAVIFFDPALAENFVRRRKRAGQLWSKHRFLSAQMLALLQDDLWLRHARAANHAATQLAQGLARIEGVRLVQKVEANEVFAVLPQEVSARLLEGDVRFYPWIAAPGSEEFCWRFVTSFASTEDEVAAALALARGPGHAS